VTSEYVRETFKVSKRYYDHLVAVNSPAFVKRRFKDVLPEAYAPSTTVQVTTNRSTIFTWVLGLFGWDVRDLVSFLTSSCPDEDCARFNRWTASYLVESALFCDLNSVMICSNHRRDLMTSAVVILLAYVVLVWIMNYMGFPGLAMLFFLAVPFVIIWYSIGVSPRCFPMIPTCLLDDTIAAFKSILPSKVTLPPMLVVNKTKLRSCSELNFTAWEDPLAFLWCDMGFCDNASDVNILDVSHWKFQEMSRYVAGKNVEAYRFCATVTATYSVPALIAATVGASLVSAILISLLMLLGPSANLLWQIMAFDHS